MQVILLQSGSNSNCIVIEAAGVRLLFHVSPRRSVP